MATGPSSLKAKLKKADADVRNYVSELERRNAKLQLKLVKLEADKVELNGRIKALEKQKPKELHIVYTTVPELESLSEDGFVERIKKFIPMLIKNGPKLGLRIERI